MAIDREKILVLAQKYVEKKKYDRAVVEYQKIIQEDPNDARILLKIGDLQSKMEAYADAIGTYERVGKFYASQGFSLKAIAVYKQIREIIARHVPKLEDQYSHITPKLAELYQQLGLTSDALAALDEVATRLQRQGREQEAIDIFRKIVELDPTNPLPHLRLAEALSRAKNVDGAVGEFGLAAGQLVKLGRRDDALKVLDRLLHHRAEPVHARTAAELYLARSGPNDGMQALAKLQICFQANPRDLDTLGLLARAFNHIGQANKAIEVQKETARLARDTGNKELFQELLAKLLKLAPNDEGVRRLANGSQAPRPSIPTGAPVDEAPKVAASSSRDSTESYEDIGETEIEEEDEDPIELSRPSGMTEPDGEVVVETTIEVVEEVAEAPTSAAAGAQISRILSDAASFRRAGFVAKAIETLHIGLEISPKAMRVHEALRDLLLEAGQTQDAVEELIVIAELYLDALDGDAAARVLQDALAIEPENERASSMLHELGYELVEESQPSVTQQGGPPSGSPMRPQYASYDPEAPLPSYDLEEIGPEDVALRAKSEPSMRTVAVAPTFEARSGGMDDIDDPFGDSPLPRFPLEPPPESAAAFDLVADGDEEPGGRTVIAAPSLASLQAGTPELESALEEAEFFATRGLYDDARAILDEQLVRLPNHPLLLERLAELDVQERGVQGVSGTRPSPAAGSVEDRAFDIAASLGTDGASEGDRSSSVGPRFGAPSEQVDVEDLFMKFKEGVAKQIDVDDAQSHYDLGVAYREMGLLDDAIREFETAERDSTRGCICCSMIGMIHLERGKINEAIEAFMRGLEVPERTRDQEAALSYEVGAAYEAKKMTKQALDYFQRCARLVPSYRDVQERARRLQKSESKQPTRAVAVGADDEFDRAFDDILGNGKLP
ncbi:MAG: tetratricopeptide repeat protein [Polyangiaceae bacterium]